MTVVNAASSAGELVNDGNMLLDDRCCCCWCWRGGSSALPPPSGCGSGNWGAGDDDGAKGDVA